MLFTKQWQKKKKGLNDSAPETYKKLKAEIQKLRECVEFYANHKDKFYQIKARKTLKEIKEGEK